MNEYIESGKFMSGETILKAVRNGIAVNEVNAKMGLVCATLLQAAPVSCLVC